MSSPRGNNESVEGIAKSARETERCGVGRGSRLPSHARSPSTSGQKSKIPTNIGHTGRPGAASHSQVQDNSRFLTSVASEDAAGGNGSPINTARRLTSRSVTAASSPPAAPTNSKPKSSNLPSVGSAMQKRQLESLFATKKKRYATLKKELTDKQKNATDLYEEMSQLRDKLIATGGRDPGKIETINLAVIPAQNCLVRVPVDFHALRGSGEQVYAPNSDVTSELVSSLQSKLRELPNRCFGMFEEALQKRSEILQWLEKFDRENGDSRIEPEIVKEADTRRKENADFETRLEEQRRAEEAALTDTIQKLSVLWNEVEVSRARIRELEVTSTDMMNELRGKVEAALAEKKCETEKCGQLQERRVALETELQKVRAKMRATETRVNEDEKRIVQLQSSVKNLEGQLKQKESSGEQRLKEMQRSLRNSESLLAKTEKQRDGFESRLNELKKSYGSKETEAENTIKQLSGKLETVNAELEKQIGRSQSKENETDSGTAMEGDDKIAALRREKEELIRLMQHFLFNEGSSFKLDNDSPHDKVVANLTKKMQDFRLNFKLAQEKNEHLEKQLTELRSRMETQSKDSGSGKWSGQAIELQQQLYDLRCSVHELKRRNEELEIQLNQKQLEIEEQDRSMREQINVLKVRDDVIALLKGEPDARGNNGDSANLPVVKRKNQRDREQVDKHIAEKAENLQQLYSTLETKQIQITRLEQLVKQMELQQDRAQEQRTRLETKIAQLQLAMHYRGKAHRYVKTENPVSSSKVSSAPLREPFKDHGTAISPSLENSLSHPRSFSRPPPPRSPMRHPQIQRSKTLNSFRVKSKLSPSKEYACQVMDEVARTLKRERAYDYKKRGLREDLKYTREDRGSEYVEENVLDPRDISKEEIHESFYNWLVEPWMFEGEPSSLILPTSEPRRNHWSRVCSPNSDIAVNPNNSEDRSPRRQRATNDCSRESRCGSPGCRRQSVPDWNSGSARLPRVRPSPQNSPATRTRLQRS